MLHRCAIEQQRKAGDRFDCERGAAACGLGYRRFQIPKDARGFRLAQRKEALAGGDKTGDGLMEIGEDGGVFSDLEHTTSKAEGGAMVDVSAGLFGSGQCRPQDRRPVSRGYGVKKIPAEGGAAEARFTGRAERTETTIDLRPANGAEIFRCGDSQPVRFTAEDSFERAGLFEISAEKFGQVGWLKNFLGGKRLEAEGMRERTDGKSGVGDVTESEFCQILSGYGNCGV